MRADVLLVATVGYLLLPNAIFAAGWLRPVWGFAVVLALLACLTGVARRARTEVAPLPVFARIVVAGLAAFWVAVSGIGELNLQVSDYIKHNLVFHDLAVGPWPVVYGAAERSGSLLCYYLAYYLPPALAAKLFGLHAAALASLLWGATGVVLAFAWVARLGRPQGAAVLVLFTLIDNLCWLPGVAYLAQRALTGAGAPRGGWWQTDGFTSRFWELAGTQNRLLFSAEPLSLVWTPQHALAAWLATACVLSVLWEGRRPAVAGLVTAAVALWSPFVVVGLLPLAAAAVWRRGRPDVSWPDLVGGAALAVPVGLYFLAHSPQRYVGMLPAALPDAGAWAKYVLFLVLAVGVIFGGVWLVQRQYALLDPPRWLAFRLTAATLLAVTLITMGKYNDWAMRVSMPGLFVLHLTAATVAAALWRSRAALRHRLAFSALVLLAAERTLKGYFLAPTGALADTPIQTTIATARSVAGSIVELRDGDDASVASQYLGSTTSLFGRYLMKEPAARGAGGAAATGEGGRER